MKLRSRSAFLALGALVLAGFALGCNTVESEASAKSRPPPTTATAAPAAPKEVVFDPNNPPPGWVKCHRNHCHHQDGRVASYAQVMKEIGATKIVGGDVPKGAPPAPPDLATTPKEAVRSPTGLYSRVLKQGAGEKKPGPNSIVTVHYTGWTMDGKSFDSSVARGQPAQFPLRAVVPGWQEGLKLMTVGEERRLWIPENLAYAGQPGRPAGMLVFDVELIAIRD